MPLDLGDAVVLEAAVVDDSDTAANATTATLTITLPDGTTTSPEVDAPAQPGAYRVSFTPAQPGLHAVRWVFTGPNRAHTDVFNVRAAMPAQLISLADAKELLKKSKTKTDNDDELRGVIGAATRIVEREIGAVVRRQVDRELHHGGRTVVLDERPIIELVSVAYARDGSTAANVADLSFDKQSGVVWSRVGLPAAELQISYVAGRPVIDDAILEATGIIVEHLWQTRRGHSVRPGMLGETPESPSGANHAEMVAYFSAGYALPNRAAELLADFADVGGFA